MTTTLRIKHYYYIECELSLEIFKPCFSLNQDGVGARIVTPHRWTTLLCFVCCPRNHIQHMLSLSLNPFHVSFYYW